MATQPTTYVLDRENHIISIIGAWDEFATENGGTLTSSKDVCGRAIWDFISGETTRMWLDVVFQFARLSGTTVERPYRCDSPDLKRFMRMRIVAEQEGVLRVEHEILSTEQRDPPVHIHYGLATRNNIRTRCSICGRLNIGGWIEPHEDQANQSEGILVTYTVCEDCQRLLPGTS